MKKSAGIIFIIVSFVFLGWVIPSAAEESQDKTASGRISGIDVNAGTVVIEVPIANDQMLTVGGPVVETATLKKNGGQVYLTAFQEGEWVDITWQKTDETLLIKALAAR